MNIFSQYKGLPTQVYILSATKGAVNMFEKLVKIHTLKNLGFFVAAYASAFLGSVWLGMTLTGSSPAPFEFAPSAVFLTLSMLVLTKGFLT